MHQATRPPRGLRGRLAHLSDDHLIAMLVFVVLLCVLCCLALSAPAAGASEASFAEENVPFAAPVRSAPAEWVWEPTPIPVLVIRPASSCDEPFRLAGAVDAEGRNQSLPVRMAMAAIIVAETRSRHMDVCGLTERTNFLSVWHYAKAYPGSWHAQQFAHPSESSLQVSRSAMRGELAAMRGNAMHFDGAWRANNNWQCRPDMVWRGGTICFYP